MPWKFLEVRNVLFGQLTSSLQNSSINRLHPPVWHIPFLVASLWQCVFFVLSPTTSIV
jgi:hypothetical protein